jgi:gliding motility-associated lipoprotein GldH
MKSVVFKTICLLAVAVLAVSCGKGKIYSEYKSIDPEKGWSQNDSVVFEPEINDLDGLFNVYVNVRHADTYPYRNLYIFLTTIYPDGRQMTDTLECMLADEQNHWKGNGAGDLWDNSILLKSNIRFPLKGKYKFIYVHGMRVDPLPQVLDVGLTIENAK